jgi:hypothetical protein
MKMARCDHLNRDRFHARPSSCAPDPSFDTRLPGIPWLASSKPTTSALGGVSHLAQWRTETRIYRDPKDPFLDASDHHASLPTLGGEIF